MLAIILVAAGEFFDELGSSIGKYEVARRRQNVYALGFLSTVWAVVIFAVVAFVIKKEFAFSLASLPTFAVRSLLELLQAYVTVQAIVKADRTTFSFIRILTIPLMVLIDMFLGYGLSVTAMLGMSIILVALVLPFFNRTMNRAGGWYVLFTAINGAITLSLYKYNITHFNSVEVEQLLVCSFLLIFFLVMSVWRYQQNPVALLLVPKTFFQSLVQGVASLLISFAYLLAPASVITTAKRSAAGLWTIASGQAVFGERKIVTKFLILFFLTVGLVLLAL